MNPIILGIFILFATSIIAATPLKVVTITDDFASITKEIGGDLVQVESLIKGSKNLHNIIPKPSMVLKVKKADLIIRLGMGQDSYIDSLIQVAKNKKIYPNELGYLDPSEKINKLEIPTEKLDGSHGDVHKHGNPHYWLSPKNGIIIAEQIKDKLQKIDPTNKSIYEKNMFLFKEKLSKKIYEWEIKAKSLKNTHFITYHKTWSYFFDEFNLIHIGTLEPLPGIKPSLKHLNKLKNIIKTDHKKTIILTANYFPTHDGKIFARDIEGTFVYASTNVGDNKINTYIELFDSLFDNLLR